MDSFTYKVFANVWSCKRSLCDKFLHLAWFVHDHCINKGHGLKDMTLTWVEWAVDMGCWKKGKGSAPTDPGWRWMKRINEASSALTLTRCHEFHDSRDQFKRGLLIREVDPNLSPLSRMLLCKTRSTPKLRISKNMYQSAFSYSNAVLTSLDPLNLQISTS